MEDRVGYELGKDTLGRLAMPHHLDGNVDCSWLFMARLSFSDEPDALTFRYLDVRQVVICSGRQGRRQMEGWSRDSLSPVFMTGLLLHIFFCSMDFYFFRSPGKRIGHKDQLPYN